VQFLLPFVPHKREEDELLLCVIMKQCQSPIAIAIYIRLLVLLDARTTIHSLWSCSSWGVLNWVEK